MGEAAVRAEAPLASVADVRSALDGCLDVLRLEDEGVDLGVGAVSDIRADAGRAARGTVLEPGALRAAGVALHALDDLAKAIAASAKLAPTIAAIGSAIVVDRSAADTIEEAFDPNGQLSGETYPELAEHRAAIASIQEQVRSTLDRLVKGDELGDDLLQDRFWTVRDDRYVLPIKSHAKRWNLGIVHGTSNTGHTVFVEPHAVIEINNRLRLAEGRLKAAEHAILSDLSRLLGVQREDVELAVGAAIRIDVAVARAGLARKLTAHRPHVGDGDVIRLAAARHPVLVLRGVAVVPNDLEVGADRPVLVLSGPNAGGKTVALKTFALCAELVRHGLFVPADPGSRVDLFREIHAVIGDQQTVEGDLSSFSAHLVALRALVDRAAPGQLVLLDEIASGTDPSQGAALGQAVLETLADRGPRVVATTHFATLKGLGATDARFAVGAVGVEDGRPTYRVTMGVTGESHAFAIAARVGIASGIIERAVSLLGHQQAELARLLRDLDEERGRAAAATREADRLRDEAARATREITTREETLRTRIKSLEETGAAEFLERLRGAERAIGQVVADLQRAPSPERVRAARATIDALSSLGTTDREDAARRPADVEPGDRVRHVKLGGPGEVVSVDGDAVEVRLGGITVRTRRDELERVGGPKAAPARGSTVTHTPRASAIADAVRLPTNTLDLRGKRVDEAQEESEKFFDRAVRQGEDRVFLLHGHGTGALKDSLRGWLRTSAYTKDWAPADEEQGGDAFTVVLLNG
jgi:DNA mismatch repair protein MutS2